ncbi:E3 ubiquitin-protein ligase PDZRN3-like isoform X3 [Notamacropus eugenii]|uniref:E3 ubiquitin-protein ligase PDZRN3-like isoform X3 n=1 Tax=Notamacropus eugenii TaxID=9315 RepID=UPI003B67E3E5
MGYDIERFVGYVNEGLLCCICQGVLEDPLQAPCEHAFCTSCIHGWLEYHRNCPEDRQALSKSMLRPLYRYMRNDLNRLQLHCRNGERGCKMICSLESVEQHERECAYGWISCTNTGGSLNKSAGPGVRKTCVHIPLQTHSDYVTLGCPVPSEQLHLSGHLSACEHLSGECPKGYVCTVLILLHNGITELRSELKLLSQVSQMMSSVQSLIAANTQFLQELEQAKVEKQKLMELLKSLQDCSLTAADGNEKPTSFHSLTQLESVRKKTQEGDNHLKKVLPSAST